MAAVFALLVVSAGVLSLQDLVLREAIQYTITSSLVTRIGVDRAVEYGGVSDRFFSSDSRGRVYHSNESNPGNLLVFDKSGQFLLIAGRPGNGPGEFGMVWDVIAAKGDTLHVIDATARRRTVLSADYKTVRSDLLPGTIYRAELLDNGKLILNGTVRTRDGFGRPLHIYDPTNRSINSFGELEGQADATSEVLRQIAVGNGDLFWTSMGGRYVLQQWNGQGRLVKQLTRSVSWFPLPSRPFDGKTPPPPRVTDVTIDSNGLLWASVSVPAADWRNHLKSYYDPNRKQRMYRTSNAAWNTVIEVINPRTATVVASKRYRGRNLGFASPNQIVFYTTDNVGRGSVAIWRLGLSKL